MKGLIVLSTFVALNLSFAARAEECLTEDCKPSSNERKSSANYDDGNALEQSNPSGATRSPASRGEAPYSDDELQKNAPENFKTKNMPIDQD